MKEVYKSIKKGDVLIHTMGMSYLTTGNKYLVEERQSQNHDPRIIDDDGDNYHIESWVVESGAFVVENSEGHIKFTEFSNMVIGDSVVANKNVGEFRAGKVYTITGRKDTDTLYVDSVGNIRFIDYFRYFSITDQAVSRHIKSQDYLSMIDCAIDTNDKAWFNELIDSSKGRITI